MTYSITVLQIDRSQSVEGVIRVVVCNKDELDATLDMVKREQEEVSAEIDNRIRWNDGIINDSVGLGSTYEGWEYDPEDGDDGDLVVMLDVRPTSMSIPSI